MQRRVVSLTLLSLALAALLLAALFHADLPAAAQSLDSTITPASPDAPAPTSTSTIPTTAPVPVERVLVVGDSITQAAQEPITAALQQQGAEVHVLAWGGTAPCDWIDPVTDQVATFDPEVVLIEFAGNDLTPCIAATPRTHPDFIDRYRTDATALTQAARAGGATVRWTSVPYIAHDDHETIARQLNDIYRSLSDNNELLALRTTVAVDGGFGLVDACRNTAECGDAPKGSPVLIRSDDGLHLADAGSARLAAVYAATIANI